MDLKEKAKKLPSCPGVYIMKDSLNNIIYVGKSKNLKNRVSSYFQNSKSHPPKTVKLVKNLKDFHYIITDTEFEAFLLECKLIQEMKPLYNRLMKSPKSYSYIKITMDDNYADIQISNEADKSDGNLYFGPYTNRNTVVRTLEGIKECCKILCNNNFRKASSCINYSLGLCIGMCLDSTANDKYLSIFHKIIKMLKGNDKSIIELMESNMISAAEKFDFETAAKYRDYLNGIRYLIDKAKVIKYTEENKNIVLLEPLLDNSIKIFLIKGNKMLFKEKYILKDYDFQELKSILKANILFYFNNEIQKKSLKITKDEIDEAQIIFSYLKNKSNNCRYAIIAKKWLNIENNLNINKAIDKLLYAIK